MSRRRRDDDDLSPRDRRRRKRARKLVPPEKKPYYAQVEDLLAALEDEFPAHDDGCLCHPCASKELLTMAWSMLLTDKVGGPGQWPHATLFVAKLWVDRLLAVVYRLREATERHCEGCACLQCTSGALMGRALLHLMALEEEQGVPDAS